jgi:hypothetical protein
MEQFENLVPTIEINRSNRKIMDVEVPEWEGYEMNDLDQYSHWLERWGLSESRVYLVIVGTCEVFIPCFFPPY